MLQSKQQRVMSSKLLKIQQALNCDDEDISIDDISDLIFEPS